jgi:predicted AAA+ superfamily ATPase
MTAELKEKFKIIIKEFHETPLPDLIKRDGIFDLTVLDSSVNKVITIIGPRRAGKTFLLFQIIKELLGKNIGITDILYINFEDERITPLKGEMLQAILDAYLELYPKREKPLVFLDEIQNVPGWDRFVRRINDQRFKVFVTGSNSRMLGREIATSLRGRTLTHEVFPFSFREFVQCHGVKIEPDLPYSKLRHRVAQLYEEYFFSGGYPEVSLLEDRSLKGRILQDYFNTIFYRDLVERYAVKNTDLLTYSQPTFPLLSAFQRSKTISNREA